MQCKVTGRPRVGMTEAGEQINVGGPGTDAVNRGQCGMGFVGRDFGQRRERKLAIRHGAGDFLQRFDFRARQAKPRQSRRPRLDNSRRLEWIEGADQAIVVANPEVSSVRDSDRIIGLLDSKTLRAERGEQMDKQLLLTRFDPARSSSGEMLSVDDVLEILSIPLLGVIPESKEILRASNIGAPVTMNASISRAGLAYLDHNATTPVRPEVVEAVAHAFALPGNPSSVHAEGRAARGISSTAPAYG